MLTGMTKSTTPQTPLAERWNAYRESNPTTRNRQAAEDLGVSEADLVEAECGLSAVRLDANWGELILKLESLGPLLALTRNDAAVHEKTGVYENAQLHETHHMGQVLGDAIDLRLFLSKWEYGFAVKLEKRSGHELRGLQFFDEHGTAVHKVYLREASDEAAYNTLIDRYRAENAGPLHIEPRPTENLTPRQEIDAERLLEEWRNLQDTHDFFPLLREVNASRLQALQIGEGEFTRQVNLRSHRQVLEGAAEKRLPIMVFVRSPGTVQIHTGPVHRLKPTGDEWFNVLDEDFNLHLREPTIDQAWVVEKPTKDGRVTSLELYDASGTAVSQFFGERKPGRPERAEWRAILEKLKTSSEEHAA
jgi:putative hemin transport protein